MSLLKGEFECSYLSVTYGTAENKQEFKKRGRTFCFVLSLKAVWIIKDFSGIVHGGWFRYNENFFKLQFF